MHAPCNAASCVLATHLYCRSLLWSEGIVIIWSLPSARGSSFLLRVSGIPFAYVVEALYGAILQALNGRACILITAGLMYPQNVTTPMMMHNMFTM
jgi:hypothetical protein